MVALLLKRYLWLVDTLRTSPEGLTLAEINDRWSDSELYRDCGGTEIDRRTFYNHRIAISEQFGIDIETIKAGPYSRYRIDIDSLNSNQTIDWLLSTIATENLITQTRNLADKILLEPADKGASYLNDIVAALKSNIILEIDYQSFHIGSPNHKSIIIEPLALKMFKRRWYLLSRKSENGELRLYALDRMTVCKLTDNRFDYPEHFSPAEYFANYFGVSTDGYTETPCRIVLRAYHELPRYMESQPLHPSQEIADKGENYTDFSYYLIPAFDFVQEILLHCEQLEVIQPQSLRQHVAEILHKSANFYK
ncbi:MAG: WYL domain-containing protein [Muribaculaceae bacterium]|nr:WYL domain-containing protein [Muribaculaceae bacterium]